MKIVQRWARRVKAAFREKAGIGLVETLAAVAILGTAGVAFVLSLSTGTIAVREGEQEAIAQSLARAQLEYIKNYPYQPAAATYPYVYNFDEKYNPNPITLPQGYEISVTVSSIPQAGGDPNIQKIRVTISREEEELLTIETYKVKR